MESFNQYMDYYRKEMKKGTVRNAYKGLMEYIMDLRTHFKNKYPSYFVSGLYYGYMDMTYFSFSPDSLKDRKLKIAVVFIHDTVRFEVWLSGQNKEIQSIYWKLFKDKNWNKYKIVPTIEGYDSIVEHVLIANPDFSNLDELTEKIEKGTLKFIQDVEEFLEEN
ncbi:MAG: hypothetical protein AMQ74_01880 [Candidatus Methanofastidiosum methylothiophilum]|uniref:DUF7000 domain-containing protein n=1 Tax=Candidatus Methanofastidiosum methylothiophilum TaxID=1705564 RepID=A0A150IM16_9EURY|nr:MAG: hypothetical protein AMQ74_01880 [Candidatus Methanofastidiosum methylthiophilus]